MSRPNTTNVANAFSLAPPARKFLLHGSPGSGKTPLATSLPWGTAGWGEGAVYVACDRKEAGLAGTLPHNRGRLITPDYGAASDPYTFVKSVLEYDWRAEGAPTVIIDTGTNLGRDFLQAAVDAGAYNSKSVTFGTSILKLADKPHYGLAHNLMSKIIKAASASPLNIIMLFWSDYQEPEDGKGAWGGPITVNMTMSKDIAGEFSNIIYTRTSTEGGRTKYFAHTENYGIWVARLHGVLPNPIPVIEMQPDPVHVWQAIDQAQGFI